MIYAKLESLENGYELDQEYAKNLLFDKYYEVEEICINSWHTDVYLKGFKKPFNSVNLSFYSDRNGTIYDIFSK